MAYMLSVLSRPRAGFRFYFVVSGEGAAGGCGLTEAGKLVREGNDFGELLLRAAVRKCMESGLDVRSARDEWDADLARFGFCEADGAFAARAEDLRLPHDCKGE